MKPLDAFAVTAPKTDAPAESVVVELPETDLIEAGLTKPIPVASILNQAGVTPNPGVAQPFTPPPSAQHFTPQPAPAQPFSTQAQLGATLPSAAHGGPAWQQHPSYAPVAMSPPPPKKKSYGWVFAVLGVVGFFTLLGVGGIGYAVYRFRVATEEAQAELDKAASAPRADTTESNVVAPPEPSIAPTTQIVPTQIVPSAPAPTFAWNTPSAMKPSAAAPAPRATTHAEPRTSRPPSRDTSATKDAPKEATKDTPEKKPEGQGTIRTFSAAAGKPITVDGVLVGVAPAPASVACGSHSVQLGSGAPQAVNVPCNGSVTVGDADGN